MAGVNRVTLLGHLGRDPEVRRTTAGAMIVNLSLATSESWRDKRTGERVEKTEWHRIVIFNENLGKVAEQYLRKGSQVYLEGKLATRKWTDQSNIERYLTEVVLANFGGVLQLLDRQGERRAGGDRESVGEIMDGRGDDWQRPSSTPAPAPAARRAGRAAARTLAEDLDDEIPF